MFLHRERVESELLAESGRNRAMRCRSHNSGGVVENENKAPKAFRSLCTRKTTLAFVVVGSVASVVSARV